MTIISIIDTVIIGTVIVGTVIICTLPGQAMKGFGDDKIMTFQRARLLQSFSITTPIAAVPIMTIITVKQYSNITNNNVNSRIIYQNRKK